MPGMFMCICRNIYCDACFKIEKKQESNCHVGSLYFKNLFNTNVA